MGKKQEIKKGMKSEKVGCWNMQAIGISRKLEEKKQEMLKIWNFRKVGNQQKVGN